MITKHFFKILALFVAMIILGLVGIFVVNYFGYNNEKTAALPPKTQVAK